ncbi:MAG: hypothetical protein H0T64_14375 [Pyrinomonadaceae bacterium]|nr:hypothetical protein [Pyrinomonadaceae bacterium]
MAKSNQVEVALEERANEGKQERGHELMPRRGVAIMSGAGALLLFLLTYLLSLDRVVGMYVDDAWYVMLAKALATGQGYTLINSPSPGILPLYPPAFPWLLSFAYQFAPQFPQNVWLFKSISIAAMLGVGIVAYRYFVRDRKLPHFLALGIALVTVVSPPLVFFATTTVMAECVFMLTQLSAIAVIERCARAGKRGRVWHYALLGAALASFAFLTRSIAFALVVAAFVYLLKERLLRAALIFAVGVVLFVGPWMLYARLHAPTAEQRMDQGGQIVEDYMTQVWRRVAGEPYLGTASVKDISARILMNTVRILRSEVGAAFVAPLTQLIKYKSPRGGEIFVLILSMLAIVGFVSVALERVTLAEIVVPLSLAIIVAWPWPPQRYVLPLAPFIVFYILIGLQVVQRLSRRLRQISNPRPRWVAAGIVVWCAVAINTLSNGKYILSLHGPPAERPGRVRNFDEVEAMFKWIRENIPKEEVIATFNPALVHLYTGHKTIFPDHPTANWSDWRRPGVRYLVFTPWHREPVFSPTESGSKVVYQSRSNQNLRVVYLDTERVETVK